MKRREHFLQKNSPLGWHRRFWTKCRRNRFLLLWFRNFSGVQPIYLIHSSVLRLWADTLENRKMAQETTKDWKAERKENLVSPQDQCTMRFPMSIDILEIHKCKNSLLAHFIVKSIHSFFRWCKTAQIFTKEKKCFLFKKKLWFFVENAEGGVWEGWNFGHF